MMSLISITGRHHTPKIRYAEEERCNLDYTEWGTVMHEPNLLEIIVALACSGAIGSLLAHGYQKWIKTR